MNIYSLRINKNTAGLRFPFDRIYLVKHEDRHILRRLFRYALVLPVEGFLNESLKQILIEKTVNRPFNRNDVESSEGLSPELWQRLLNNHHLVMAVPLLTKWMQKNRPRYLTAKRWYREKQLLKGRGKNRQVVSVESNGSPFPDLTYLQTPDKNIRPVCIFCPRYIMHQNGECQIGEEVCFTHLPLGLHDYFKEGLDIPDATPSVKETDVTEIINNS